MGRNCLVDENGFCYGVEVVCPPSNARPIAVHRAERQYVMVRLSLLGPLACRNGDGEGLSAVVRAPKRLAVLAYLAVASPRGFHRRDTLLGLFWADSDQDRARATLRQTLLQLRNEVGDALIARGTEEVGVDRARFWCDAVAFEEALDAGDLEDALEFYQQDLLDGFYAPGAGGFERWLDGERRRLRNLAAEAAWKLAEERREDEADADAARMARRAYSFTPYDEAAFQRLIRFLDGLGDRLGALREYERFALLVQEEYKSEPGPETQALIEAIRGRTDAKEGAVAGYGTTTRTGGDAPSETAVGGVGPDTDVGVLVAPTPTTAASGASRWFGQTSIAAGVTLAIILTLGAAWLFTGTGDAMPRIGTTQRLTIEEGLELDPAISPDGERVVFAAGPPETMSLFVLDLSTDERIELTEGLPGHHRSPTWSPDGSRIAFETRVGDGSTAYVISVESGEKREIVSGSLISGAQMLGPTWSPDGQEIAYKRDRGLYVRPVDGGDERYVATALAPHSLAWSPSGEWIAYVSGNTGFKGDMGVGNIAPSSIWLTPAAGGRPIRITGEAFLDTSPVWSTDSRYLYFISNREGSRDVYRVPISDTGESEGAALRMTAGLDPHTISLSADGRRLAYSVLDYSANIWSLPLPKAGEEAVSIAGAEPFTTGSQVIESLDVSRDGRFLVFDSNRRGNQDIWVMPIEGGEPVQITRDPADDFGPTWSPDGSEIAFYSFRGGDRYRDLYVVDAAGGKPVQVTDYPGHEAFPDWSPDGRSLVFQVNPPGGADAPVLARIHRDSAGNWSRREQLATGWANNSRWSPDGQWIAFVAPNSLRLLPADGGEPRVLVEFDLHAGFPEWSPDGSTIYYRRILSSDEGFWAVSPEGGPPRLVVRADDPTMHAAHGMLATDGERLYFTVVTYESDIWVVDLE